MKPKKIVGIYIIKRVYRPQKTTKMHLGPRVTCGLITPEKVGSSTKRPDIIAASLDALIFTRGGNPLSYDDLVDAPIVTDVVGEYNDGVPTSSAVFAAIDDGMNTKQDLLTVDGVVVSAAVLSNFALTVGQDGSGYSNSLLTAGAIEKWFEKIQESLIMTMPGHVGPGFRAATIGDAAPSAINVPSCLAVSSYVTTRVADATSSIMNTLTNYVSTSFLYSYLFDNYKPLNILRTFTIEHANFGIYTVTLSPPVLTAAPGTGDFTLSMSLYGINDYFISYSEKTEISFKVFIRDKFGTFRDSTFEFICVQGGVTITHGTVNDVFVPK
jgi:hypothetical protein